MEFEEFDPFLNMFVGPEKELEYDLLLDQFLSNGNKINFDQGFLDYLLNNDDVTEPVYLDLDNVPAAPSQFGIPQSPEHYFDLDNVPITPLQMGKTQQILSFQDEHLADLGNLLANPAPQLSPQVFPIVPSHIEYEVEQIIDQRKKKGKEEFLVLWKGFLPEESTWEPVEHLESAHALLEEFKKMKKKPKKPAKATKLAKGQRKPSQKANSQRKPIQKANSQREPIQKEKSTKPQGKMDSLVTALRDLQGSIAKVLNAIDD